MLVENSTDIVTVMSCSVGEFVVGTICIYTWTG